MFTWEGGFEKFHCRTRTQQKFTLQRRKNFDRHFQVSLRLLCSKRRVTVFLKRNHVMPLVCVLSGSRTPNISTKLLGLMMRCHVSLFSLLHMPSPGNDRIVVAEKLKR